LIQLALFSAKSFIVFIVTAAILVTFFALLAKGKSRQKEKLVIKNLNKKYEETSEAILAETMPKKMLKNFFKEKKQRLKSEKKSDIRKKTIYVLDFFGDIKASAVSTLREEVTAILNVATPEDEVLVRLESAGGMVHAYGLAAAQLMRFKAQNIPLTICIDKIAASGGYMMACIADKILAAPFAIIGSIGVVVQFPNFNRLLKDNHIDFEQHTAGKFKRTITLFGENTEEGREKLQHEIEDIHGLFKNLIQEHRPKTSIDKVATGEHWLGTQAMDLKLVDEIKTSDAYLLDNTQGAQLFEISMEVKKPLMARLFAGASALKEKMAWWMTEPQNLI